MLKKLFNKQKQEAPKQEEEAFNEETNPLFFELIKRHKDYEAIQKALREKVVSLALKHIEDDNCADYYGKHTFGIGGRTEFKDNEGMYCLSKAWEDVKKKLQTATGDKKILYTEIVDYYGRPPHQIFLLKKTMLQENFTTMKKISSCQIKDENAIALIKKMIENQDRDSLYDSQDNIVGYEICVDRLEGVTMDDNDDNYTPEEQKTAQKLQEELQSHNIQSIIHFIF